MDDNRPLMTWSFAGPRFDTHGVELADLQDLVHLRSLLMDIVKHLWRRDNPDRGRLPNNFEQAVVLKVFGICPGSATFPITYEVRDSNVGGATIGLEESIIDQRDVTAKLPKAASAFKKAVRAAREGTVFPAEIPRSLLARFKEFGATLGKNETVVISTPDEPDAVTFDEVVRDRLVSQSLSSWTDIVDVSGSVTAASLAGRGTLEVDGAPVDIVFEPEHEHFVTRALYEHDRARMRVRGRGTFEGPSGRLKKIYEVETIELFEGELPTQSGRPIWEALAELSSAVPEKEWERVPSDLSTNVDNYLYGTAKRRSQ